MKHRVDPACWERLEYYDFFGQMDDPFWGTVVPVDFTSCYEEAKRDGASFFLYSLHRILSAVNRIEELRYRIEGGDVVWYDEIHVSPTIGREDGTFGFGFMTYAADRETFVRGAMLEIKRVCSLSGLCLGEGEKRTDVVYFSSIPWFSFTEMKHAGSLTKGESVPRISTGRLFPADGRLMMPVSLDVHHGLADGRHAGAFFELLGQQEG